MVAEGEDTLDEQDFDSIYEALEKSKTDFGARIKFSEDATVLQGNK